MAEVFVVRNQLGHYWGKGKAWVDGTEPKAVMHVKHEDEAVNTLFELSSRDIELRGEVVGAELSERGIPLVEPSEHLLPKEPDEPAQEPQPGAATAGYDAPAGHTDEPGDTSTEQAENGPAPALES